MQRTHFFLLRFHRKPLGNLSHFLSCTFTLTWIGYLVYVGSAQQKFKSRIFHL